MKDVTSVCTGFADVCVGGKKKKARWITVSSAVKAPIYRGLPCEHISVTRCRGVGEGSSCDSLTRLHIRAYKLYELSLWSHKCFMNTRDLYSLLVSCLPSPIFFEPENCLKLRSMKHIYSAFGVEDLSEIMHILWNIGRERNIFNVKLTHL